MGLSRHGAEFRSRLLHYRQESAESKRLSGHLSIGKYAVAQPFEDFWHGALDLNAFRVLAITVRHAAVVSTLPYPPNRHRDPFDRIIVAQVMVEGMSMVSCDPLRDAYAIARIW